LFGVRTGFILYWPDSFPIAKPTRNMQNLKWISTQLPDSKEVQLLSEALTKSDPFPLSLANILVQRGITNLEQAQIFFRPETNAIHDSFLMKNMDQAVNRIIQTQQSGGKILVYGDYDVDGTTSVALVSQFLEDWGILTDFYIPDRATEGYGISYHGIDYAVGEGIDLIIALDCGTKEIDKVSYARSKKIDMVICDHHTTGSILPDAAALLNPKQPGCDYPFKELSACGIGMKLCMALEERFKNMNIPISHQKTKGVFESYSDLVALSIACDIVPITGENRVLAFHGLKKIQSDPLPGIRALMNMSEYEREWDVSDLVFFIGPRINAAGRLAHGRNAVELLRGKTGNLNELASGLERRNTERKDHEERITASALELFRERKEQKPHVKSAVLFHEEWVKGVIGIVASRLQESNYQPTILLTRSNGDWVGSGRSVAGFDLYKALEHCREHILQFGGHTHAVGLTIDGKKLHLFREAFEEYAGKELLEEQLVPKQEINYGISFKEISPVFMRLLPLLGPFGPGNMEPVFETKGVKVKGFKILKEVHLRLDLERDGFQFQAIAFKMREKWDKIESKIIDIAYQPVTKKWKGNEYIQLMIKDFQPSG